MSKKDLVTQIQGYNFLATYKVERSANIKTKLLALQHMQEGKSIQETAKYGFLSSSQYQILVTVFFCRL